MSFKLLQHLRHFIWKAVPLICTKMDLDILVAIGVAEEEGRFLNMKQLGLLDIGSAATLRRRIAWLVKCGYLSKVRVQGDGRVAVFRVNARLKKAFAGLGAFLNSDSGSPGASGRRKK